MRKALRWPEYSVTGAVSIIIVSHCTYAIAEEHQGNGRAEGAILRIKPKTRTLLQASELNPEEWPLAARQAGHALQNQARERLGMVPKPSIPEVRRETAQGVGLSSWKTVLFSRRPRCCLHRTRISRFQFVELGLPGRRLREKTAVRRLDEEPCDEEMSGQDELQPFEALAKEKLKQGDFEPETAQ